MVNPLECTHVTEVCTIPSSIYGYKPSIGSSAFFVAFFTIATIANLYFGIRHRTWTYLIAMTFACAAQVIGYIGRIFLHINPFNMQGFEVQICCLTLAPAFNSAAIYLTLKHIILCFGPEWSRLRPMMYTYAFILADVLALIFQAIGGAMAATAITNDSLQKIGDNLMMTGIAWQVITLLIFITLTIDYILRRRSALPFSPLTSEATKTLSSPKFRFFAAGLLISFIAVLTRCIYRIAEMAGGWGNPIMQNEALFVVLDGCMVALATLCQTAAHPGVCFPRLSDTVWTGEGKKGKRGKKDPEVVEKEMTSGSGESLSVL